MKNILDVDIWNNNTMMALNGLINEFIEKSIYKKRKRIKKINQKHKKRMNQMLILLNILKFVEIIIVIFSKK